MVNIVDLRPSRPGFDRRRKRQRQSDTSKSSSSYWHGDDGTVVRQDGTVETPAAAAVAGSTAATDSPRPAATSPATNCQEVTPSQEERQSSPSTGVPNQALDWESSSVAASALTTAVAAGLPAAAASSPVTAAVAASPESTPTVASPSNKLQHQIDFLEEQLQIRSTKIESLEADLQTTKAQLVDKDKATVAAATETDAHEQAIMDMHQEHMKEVESLTEQHERTLQKRDAKHAKVSDMHQEDMKLMELLTEQHERALQERDAQHARVLDKDPESTTQTQYLMEQHERVMEKCDVKHARALQRQQELHDQQLATLTENCNRVIQKCDIKHARALQRQRELHDEQLATQQQQFLRRDANERNFIKEWNQLQELQEKGVRDAQQASVWHANELQRYKDQLEGSDSKLLLAEHEIQVLKEMHRLDLELVDEKYTNELQQREEAHILARVQMGTNKAKESGGLGASLLEKTKDDSTLQKVLKASDERHKHDLAQADKPYHRTLRERDARHQEQMEEMQLALKAQTDEIAGLTTSLHEQELGNAVLNLQTETEGLESSHDLEKRMKEENAAELRKRDEYHRRELERLQGVVRSKTTKILAMKGSLHSLKGSLKMDLKTPATDGDHPVRRPFIHPEPTPKPFGHSSQVLEVELAIASEALPESPEDSETPATDADRHVRRPFIHSSQVLDPEVAKPAIASNALPESPKVLKKQTRTVEANRCRSPRIEPSSAGKEPRESEDNENASGCKKRRSGVTPADSRVHSTNRAGRRESQIPKGRDRSADSKQLECFGGTPVDSLVPRSFFASNRASRSLSLQLQSPKCRERSAETGQQKRPGGKLSPVGMGWQSPRGRDRSADPKQRKRPGVKLIPGASLTDPSSAVSSSAKQRKRPDGKLSPVGSSLSHPISAVSSSSKQRKRPDGKLSPVDGSLTHPSSAASSSAKQRKCPDGKLSPVNVSLSHPSSAASSKAKKRKHPDGKLSPVDGLLSHSSSAASRSAKQRKHPDRKLSPVDGSQSHPSSAASSRASQRSPLRRRESVAKPRPRIVIDSTGSDSDTVFSPTNV